MTLDCKDNLIPFYKAIGYKLEPGNANSMTVRYDEEPAADNPSWQLAANATIAKSKL